MRSAAPLGATSETLYDARGLVIETRSQTTPDALGNPQWLVTRTVYDAKGRAVWTVDSSPLVGEGQGGGPLGQGTFSAHGTYTIYDSLDRVRESRRYEDVRIDVAQDPNNPGALMSVLVAPDLSLPEPPAALSRTLTDYDVAGRVRETTNADGLVTRYDYDKAGRQKAVVIVVNDPAYNNEYRTNYEYDAAGRQISVTDAMNRTTRYQYDAAGNVIETTFPDPDGPSGPALSPVTSTTYDTQGRRTSETDALGRTTEYEYDPRGNLKTVLLPAIPDPEDLDTSGNPILKQPRYDYEYDVYGNHVLIRDPKGRETRFTYDELGRQKTRSLPLGQTESFEYNSFGQQVLHTSFEGVVTQSIYDNSPTGAGQLLEQRYFTDLAAYDDGLGTAAETVSYDYDDFGRLFTVTDARGTTQYAYDEEGRTTQIASPEGTINYGYDTATGRLVRTFTGSDPNDPVTDVGHDYDQLGRLSTVTVVERNNQALTTPEVWRYAYDPVGNLQRLDLANGIILDYVYDNLNRLEDLIHYAPDGTPNDLSDNPRIAQFDYELRADGKREALNETFWENGVAKTNRTDWTYDAVGRLVDEVFDSWDDTLDYAAHYTLDLVGNRLAKTTDQGRDGTIDETIASTFDPNDRLLSEVKDVATGTDTTTTYSYGGPTNPATMQTKKEVRDTATGTLLEQTTFAYNLQNRLSHAATEQFDSAGNVIRRETSDFEYETRGIRTKATRTIEVDDDSNASTPLVVESSTETSYLNDPQNLTGYSQVLEETVRDLLSNTVARQLIYTIAHDVLAQTLFTPGGPTNGETLLVLPDGHGTTRMLADLAGQILTAAYKADGTTPVPFLLYDAFGNPLNFAPSLARTALLYAGEQFDPLLAHYYLRARYYNPATAGFTRVDPYSGDLDMPVSMHRYLYSHADPSNRTDPNGMWSAAGVSVSTGVIGALVSLTLGGVNSIYGLWSGRMNTGAAISSFGKWAILGVLGGLGLGMSAGFLLTGFGLGVGARAALALGIVGGISGSISWSGGLDEFLTGISQKLLDWGLRENWAVKLQQAIRTAGAAHGIPPELLASVLMAEQLDHTSP